MESRKNITNISQFFTLIILIFVFAGLIYFMNARIDCLLSSDESSELVLGKLLSSENGLLSKNWYYSTELRVLNTQILYAFFFHITNDWHVVRILSYVCMYLFLLLSYWLLCKLLNCKKYPITAILLFLPFSNTYFEIVLKGAYYIPHIIIIFLTLALSEMSVKGENWKNKMCLGVSIVLSLVVGLGGGRQVVVLYIPLVLSATIMKIAKYTTDLSRKKYLSFAFLTFGSAIIGYLINTRILSKIYHFMLWDDISFSLFNFQRLSTILNGFLQSYGFKNGNIFSIALIANILCAVWIISTIGAIIYAFKNKESISESILDWQYIL